MSTAINISEASKLTGLTCHLIRIWELRYGWPKPKRLANGYRSYTRADIEGLIRVRDLAKTGVPVGTIILDGIPTYPSQQVTRSTAKEIDFSSVPQPTTERGKVIRRELEDAIAKGDSAHIAMARHLVPTIHPSDRGPAVLDVLRVAGVES